MRPQVYWLTCVFLMLFAAVAGATTIVMPTDDQLIAKSPLIVEGTVLQSAAVDRGSAIWTESTVSVSKVLKGSAADTVTIREIGGQIDNRLTKVLGAPEYHNGEHVLLFLSPTPRGDYQTVDLYVGKFVEESTLAGERLWSRHDDVNDVTLLDRDFDPIAPSHIQRDADRFEQYVGDRAAGRIGTRGYEVSNPVIAHQEASPSRIESEFTMISEPTIYRWFAFDQGQTAKWYSNGTQPGYTNGGVNEIQTAINVWSGYSSALIRYAYSGTTSTMGGLSSPNGINEILFNDPKNEISGSWNPSTGGVVGQGGFNAVSGSATWNAPFTADTTHTQRAYTAWNITEGNLTIQDNVSPTQGISSSTLAEIVAHEFGHTLGFGHSSDSTALMYATVSPGGPSLRADDQVAARWLYPNGTVTPPPTTTVPAAPSNLAATGSSNLNVTLSWNDNASNETLQSVYMAGATGSFSKVGDVAAGSTSVTLTGFTTGTYRFYVTASNSAGESAASNTASVTLGATVTLQAAFAYTPQSGTAGQTTFTFSDQSAGSPTSWQWNFGDGTGSQLQNPSKLYAFGGTYSVTLTISRSGAASSSVTHTISVANPVPATPPVAAAFTFAPTAPSTNQSVVFTDQSTGSPTSWSWSFGDGFTSTQRNPQHGFTNAGTYSVTLTVANSVSSSTVTHAVAVVQSIVPYRSLVPVITQTEGAGGSSWRTELTIFNAGTESVAPQLIFVPSAGGQVQSRAIYLAPRQSVTYSNALLEIFGLQNTAGGLAIEADGYTTSPDLRVSSRTFTDGTAGSYGQAVGGVLATDLPSTTYLTGLESDTAFRTNVGLVNRSGGPVNVTLELFDSVGNRVGITSLGLAANSFQQTPLTTLFGSVVSQVLTMRVTAGVDNAVGTYASIVDNRTQDPVYVQSTAAPAGGRMIIPAVGHVAGANGTFWRSDVTMYNPTSSTMTLSLRYLPAGTDDRFADVRTVPVGAGKTLLLADVLTWMGVSSGTGALDLRWTTGAGPVVTSRTYTTTTSGGTYGQSIDPVTEFTNDTYVPGLRSDARYRSNVGFANGGDDIIGVTTELLGSNGQVLATGFVALQPRSQMQMPLASMFPSVNVQSLGSVTLKAHVDGAANLFAYGSIVDNTSGDPVFYAGK